MGIRSLTTKLDCNYKTFHKIYQYNNVFHHRKIGFRWKFEFDNLADTPSYMVFFFLIFRKQQIGSFRNVTLDVRSGDISVGWRQKGITDPVL